MEYSLLCLHVRFNKPEMEAVMGPGTVYISMLRDPVDVFESQYGFFGLQGFYGMTIGINDYYNFWALILFPLDDFAAAPKTKELLRRANGQGRNQMLFDLGLDPEDMDDDTLVRRKIEEIEDSFHLIMIAEHFSESLVLMKSELCWAVEDVTNFKLNGRKDQVKSNLSNKTRNLLREFLRADYMLYNHFYQKLQSKMEKLGEAKLAAEVSVLEQANRELSHSCSVKPADNAKLKGDQKWWGPNLVGYSVQNSTNEKCALMTMPELVFIQKIRDHQREKANIILENRKIHEVAHKYSYIFKYLKIKL